MAADADREAPTRLAALRRRAGYSQADMVRLTGLTRSTYWRLDTGKYDNPPLRFLNNCAIVLGVELAELIEPKWLDWLGLPATNAARPPARRTDA